MTSSVHTPTSWDHPSTLASYSPISEISLTMYGPPQYIVGVTIPSWELLHPYKKYFGPRRSP